VARYGIDDRTGYDAVGDIGLELCSFRHGTRYDRGRRRAKYQLEEILRLQGNAGPGERVKGRTRIVQEKSGRSEKRVTRSKHQPETDKPEKETAERKIHQVLHEDIAGVFGTAKTRFQQGETGLHEHDEHGSKYYPYRVQGNLV